MAQHTYPLVPLRRGAPTRRLSFIRDGFSQVAQKTVQGNVVGSECLRSGRPCSNVSSCSVWWSRWSGWAWIQAPDRHGPQRGATKRSDSESSVAPYAMRRNCTLLRNSAGMCVIARSDNSGKHRQDASTRAGLHCIIRSLESSRVWEDRSHGYRQQAKYAHRLDAKRSSADFWNTLIARLQRSTGPRPRACSRRIRFHRS